MQRSNFFEWIRETPALLGLAMVLALVPAVLAARARWRGWMPWLLLVNP